MLYIYCPYCQEMREDEEFHYAGEAHLIRPKDPESLSDQQWGEYLFYRSNNKGSHREMWFHAASCKKFFNISRNTINYQIERTYKLNEPAQLDNKEVNE